MAEVVVVVAPLCSSCVSSSSSCSSSKLQMMGVRGEGEEVKERKMLERQEEREEEKEEGEEEGERENERRMKMMRQKKWNANVMPMRKERVPGRKEEQEQKRTKDIE